MHIAHFKLTTGHHFLMTPFPSVCVCVCVSFFNTSPFSPFLCVCPVVSLSPSLPATVKRFVRYYDVDESLLDPLRYLLLKTDHLVY